MSCAVPGRTLYLAYSLDGLCDDPHHARGRRSWASRTPKLLDELVPDVSGVGTLTFPVADGYAGSTLWWQVIDQLGNVSDIESAVVQ